MISIILPTYNSITFLQERINTIINQTYKNWECIIIDGYSTDGTWEKLNFLFEKDNRFRLYQCVAKGPYNAWNIGIKKAKGDYIYIATSDDTMSLDFLDIMYHNLKRQTDCAIAHCNLTIIDKTGNEHKIANWDNFYPRQFFGKLLDTKHIRLAPHDGILHCGLKTIYTSITQLLIRKNVFDRYGFFLEDYGSIADFEWGMRNSLISNVLHVPYYLATWRKHENQLTTEDIQTNPLTYKTLRKFIKMAFKTAFENHIAISCYSKDLYDYYLYTEYKLIKKKSKEHLLFILKNPRILELKIKNNFELLDTPLKWIKEIINKNSLNKNLQLLNDDKN